MRAAVDSLDPTAQAFRMDLILTSHMGPIPTDLRDFLLMGHTDMVHKVFHLASLFEVHGEAEEVEVVILTGAEQWQCVRQEWLMEWVHLVQWEWALLEANLGPIQPLGLVRVHVLHQPSVVLNLSSTNLTPTTRMFRVIKPW